jgi:hypothetical protein
LMAILIADIGQSSVWKRREVPLSLHDSHRNTPLVVSAIGRNRVVDLPNVFKSQFKDLSHDQPHLFPLFNC